MGGSSSTSKTDIHTSNVVEALSKSIQNCQSNTVINQQVVIKGNYNVVKKVRLVQGMKLSSACALDDKNVAAAQQAVENAVKQQTEAQNVALLGALSSSDSDTDLKISNEVKAAITRETIQNIINNFNATQEFYLDGNSNIVEDISMEQSMEALYDGCLAAVSQMASVQAIQNNADQVSKSSQTNPISEIIGSIGSIITNMGSMWTIIIIVAMVVGGYVLINGGFLGTLLGSSDAPLSMYRPPGMPQPGLQPAAPPMYRPPPQQMYQQQMPMYQQQMQQPSAPPMYQQQMPMYGMQPMQPR
jgi:hypothetical protein